MPFDEAQQIVRRTGDLLARALEELQNSPAPPHLSQAALGAFYSIHVRFEEVVDAIPSGEYDDALREHHLEDGDPDLNFKSAVFHEALSRFSGNEGATFVAAYDPPWWARWARLLARPLRAGDVILKSVLDAIPGVGAGLDEIKGATETALDLLSDTGQ